MKSKLAISLDSVHIYFIWLAICQLVAYLMSISGPLALGEFLYQSFGVFIPSVARMDRVVFFDNTIAKQYASILISSIPAQFLILLFLNMEDSISGVRKNKKENFVASVFFVVGALVFISGFNFSGPGNVFRDSIYGFGLLAATVSFLSAYCFRIVFCIVFNK